MGVRASGVTFVPAHSTVYVRIVFEDTAFTSHEGLAAAADKLRAAFNEICTVAVVIDPTCCYALSVTPAIGDVFNEAERQRLLDIAFGMVAARRARATFTLPESIN